MAAEPGTLNPGLFSSLRKATGTPVIPDAAQDKTLIVNPRGYETILAVPIITGGAAPTVELTPYLYDPDRDAFYPHTSSGVLTSGQVIEVAAMGFKLFLGITNVTGAPTAIEILIGPGRRSRWVEE